MCAEQAACSGQRECELVESVNETGWLENAEGRDLKVIQAGIVTPSRLLA